MTESLLVPFHRLLLPPDVSFPPVERKLPIGGIFLPNVGALLSQGVRESCHKILSPIQKNSPLLVSRTHSPSRNVEFSVTMIGKGWMFDISFL